MKQRDYGTNTLIGLAILIVVTVVTPSLGDWEPFPFEDNYIGYSDNYTASTYGRTASFSNNETYTINGDWGVQAEVSEGMLTAWVSLDDVEGTASSSAWSVTAAGLSWEYSGAPGTAPPLTIYQSSQMSNGEVWAFGHTTDDDTSYPYPALSVEAEAMGDARALSPEFEFETGVSGYATGWVDGAHTQSTAYAVLMGNHSQSPVTWSQVSGVNGEFDYDVQYWMYFTDDYETASGLSYARGGVAVELSAWASGSASDTGESDTDVYGQGGAWHGYSTAAVWAVPDE